ncbi:MAG TPA: nitrate- and nitrite sensing domain-containing protein [Actinomycetales bacterium]|nr:nitrate- and nitrite sensing domain-containing protein [Actinomycetales bacterium]
MLRNQGIRTKLLAVLALPIVALIVMAMVVSLQTFGEARKASEVEKLAKGADTLGQLVTAIQSERSISAQLLEKKPVAEQVKKARQTTDQALVRTRGLLAGVDITQLSPQAVAAVGAATAGHEQLGNVRAQVDSGYAQADQVNERYTSMIANDISLSSRIGVGLENRSIGRQLSVFSSAQTLAEVATQERELVLSMIGQGKVNQATATQLAAIEAREQEALAGFRLDATAKQKSDLDAAVYLPVEPRASYSTMKAEVTSLANGDAVKINSSEWRNASNDRLAALQKLLPSIAKNVADEAAAASSSASNTALLVLVGGLLLVALLLGLGLVLARAITRPLRHLTHVAGEVAEELPRMVERMATPGEGPGVTLPEIPFRGEDEVGQLAAAFREVNDTTVRVAEEQAALRASIAEMFVNVARRNHVLLSRQLSFIDQLERTEENPDTLDNLFRLDHLATRMRRNAESLIVLAGIDAGRRLRRPMPLSDVIRTAVSEIERYDRVDLALQADPPMVGHVALTTAHLLAEMLENATQFSNPDTRVIASTAFSARGVRITITDLGLGMTWDEINEANQRIASPPATEVVGSQRLGFYVVGRLARRLDASVELKPGRAQGTVVTIDLPPALFVSGTVVEATPPAEPVAEEAQAPASTESAETPSAADAGDRPSSTASGLPTRGGSGAAAPSVPPASPAPSAPAALDGGLPRRSAGAAATPPPAAPAAAPEAEPVAPRAGMFSSFRSRRAVESEVGSVAPVEPTSLEALANDLPEFVPTLDTSTPALPHRSEVPATPALPPRGDVQASDDEVTTVEVEDDEIAAPALEAFPTPVLEPETVPGLADEPSVGTDVSELPTRRLDPLDAEWQPEAEQVAEVSAVEAATEIPEAHVPADQPLVALLADEPDPVATAVEVEIAAEPEPEPETVTESVPLVSTDPVESGTQARSALSELARGSSQSDDAADPEPLAPQPVPAVPVTPVGAPAMDILPTRSGGRGLRLRRTSRPKVTRPAAVPAPVQRRVVPAAPQPAVPTQPAAPTTTFAPVPAATPSFGAAAPDLGSARPDFGSVPTPDFGSAPAPVPAAVDEVVPAPSSLFAPPPASVEEAPSEPAAPTPAFPAASVPALVAAQSLRERSAMASEALSELSALSTYRPESVTGGSKPASLVRRTPAATPAAQLAQPQEPQGPRRANRNAADVRSMLSGFRAGVERGRTSPGTAPGTAASPYPEGSDET